MAIPLFVKVTPFVAKKMQLDTVRFKTADGNYILRQSDFLPFGPLYRLGEYVAQVGGVILRDADAAANQRGELNTPLPEPTDPQWIDPDEPEAANDEIIEEAAETIEEEDEVVEEAIAEDAADEIAEEMIEEAAEAEEGDSDE